MKRAHKLLVLVALVLALTTMLPGALAYFTTNTGAQGVGPALAFGTSTTGTETVKDWVKTLTVTNDGVQDVYLRAKVFADVTVDATNEGWTLSGDYYYYNKPLAPADAATFEVEIKGEDGTVNGAPFAPGTDEALPFDVTIVYETAPVRYQANGQHYLPADPGNWIQQMETK